jgi:hypothetical protein
MKTARQVLRLDLLYLLSGAILLPLTILRTEYRKSDLGLGIFGMLLCALLFAYAWMAMGWGLMAVACNGVPATEKAVLRYWRLRIFPLFLFCSFFTFAAGVILAVSKPVTVASIIESVALVLAGVVSWHLGVSRIMRGPVAGPSST